MSEQAGRYQRSFGGMIGAMIVLVLVVLAFVAFRDINRDDPADPAQPVDYENPAAFAREEADFPVLVPSSLPSGWIATSVRFQNVDTQSWHLGLLTDQRRYVGLEQAPRPISAMVEQYVDENAVQGEDVTIDGQAWQTWTDAEDTALVRQDPKVTTMVVGTVDEKTLVSFTKSLG